MSEPVPLQNGEVIDVGPPTRRRWRRWLIGGIIVVVIVLSRSLSIFLSATWFGSLGFSAVYWYIFKLKLGCSSSLPYSPCCSPHGVLACLSRSFASHAGEATIVVNNQPIQFSPARFVKPISWAIPAYFGLYGLP